VPRPEQYGVVVPSFLATESDIDFITEAGDNLITEIEDTPSPDPDNPAIYP
jgi:hypothetical protein